MNQRTVYNIIGIKLYIYMQIYQKCIINNAHTIDATIHFSIP
jgi:hypothetical protein